MSWIEIKINRKYGTKIVRYDGSNRRRVKMMRNNSGFTLMELLITLAIFTVLASLGTTSFINWYPKYKLRSAADDVYVTLQRAKLHAIKEHVDVIVSFDPDNDGALDGDYAVFEDDDLGGFFLDPGEQIVELGEMPSGISITSVSVGNPGLGVQFTSRAISSGITVTIGDNNGQSRQVVVGLNGNIRIP